MSGPAWSPQFVPDVADPTLGAFSGGGAGVTIAPTGIATLEAFGSATVSVGAASNPSLVFETWFNWETAGALAGISSQQFVASLF